MNHNHTHTKRKRSKRKHTLFREYRFELTVATLFGLGIFLLTEKMQIKSYIFHLILRSLSIIKTILVSIFYFITDFIGEVETSDIVGIILILIGIWMIYMRARYRIIRKYSFLDICPSCDGDLRRVHRTLTHKLIELILLVKVKHYSCKKCTYRGITIDYRSK